MIRKEKALLGIPQKNTHVKETLLDSGDLVLTYRAVYKPFFLKIKKFLRSNKNQTFKKKIQLDGLGVHVWSLVDGKKNVKSIIEEFADYHKLNIKESELSVTQFLRSLGERGLIGIKEP